ncbi:MAG: hypothetical protein BRC50_15595 [Cyanobacteria bacterium SW_11_48_12]|jgi:polyhydroxyalkanoate synthesis regulator phasin|nr:MAG: hypothetical protein BRC50_15595 [Cyanobacteria bacterium SW_11_48_12]
MNANSFFELVQQGFRVALGATASLGETLQDPQKREQAISEWEQKGENTEQEARSLLEQLLSQQEGNSASTTGTGGYASSASAPSANPETQSQLQQLIEQIVELRTELEKLRQSESER